VLPQFDVRPEDNLSASAPEGSAAGKQVRYFMDGQQITDAALPLQRAVAENREIPPVELEIELPSGRRWFTEASGALIRDAPGNVISGIAVTVDITERKRAEEALRESEERFQLALRNAPVSVSAQDHNLQCVWAIKIEITYKLVRISLISAIFIECC